MTSANAPHGRTGAEHRFEAVFADNPLGHGSEQTPMAVVLEHP